MSSQYRYLHIKGFVFPINHGCKTRCSHLTVSRKKTKSLRLHVFQLRKRIGSALICRYYIIRWTKITTLFDDLTTVYSHTSTSCTKVTLFPSRWSIHSLLFEPLYNSHFSTMATVTKAHPKLPKQLLHNSQLYKVTKLDPHHTLDFCFISVLLNDIF